ncbi:MAG: hypothetical protein AAFO04_12815 [Cyanobacteria bacterium J06592_8]
MSTSFMLLFWLVILLLTIPWLVKILTGRKEEAISEIVFLLMGLFALWVVGGVIAIMNGRLDYIFQTWFSQVRLSQTQKQLIQGVALVLAAILILNVDRILARLRCLFLQMRARIQNWRRKD